MKKITNLFEYRKPDDAGVERITKIRQACRDLAALLASMGQTREMEIAIEKLEEVSMWANKSVVFNPSKK